MAKFNCIYSVCDTETGGLSEKTAGLVEVSFAFLDNDLVELEEYTSGIIAPYNSELKYEEGALRVNCVSIEQIQAGKSSKEVVEEICQLLSKYKRGREKPVVVAHNWEFDRKFLTEFFKFHKKDLFDYINPEFSIDTMWFSRMKYTDSVNFKLSTCLSNAGIETDSQHRALADTQATRELVKRFITDLRSEGVSSISGERYRNKFEF